MRINKKIQNNLVEEKNIQKNIKHKIYNFLYKTVTINNASRPQIIAFYTSLILGGISLTFAILGSLLYTLEQQQRFADARQQAKREISRVTLKIDRKLYFAQRSTLAIANDLTTGKLSDDQLLERLKSEIEANTELLDIGVAYQPFAYRPDVRFYAPFYARIDNEIELIEFQKNYTRPKYAWYSNTLNKGPNWAEPYLWSDTSTVTDPVVGFFTPFYNPDTRDKSAKGIVYSEYSLSTIREIMQSLDLGRTGYGFIISQTGTYLYHPNEEYFKSQANVFDITYEQQDEKLRELVVQALKGTPVEASLTDEVTGQNSWLFLRTTNRNGWVVGIVFIQDEILPDSAVTRRKLIGLSIAYLWSAVFLSILLFRAYQGGVKRIALVSFIITILFVANIGFVWNLVLRARTYTATRNLLLSDTGVTQLLAPQIELSQELNQEPPLIVPTGVYIQSFDFTSPKDAYVTGYIWQVYEDGVHDELSRGVILPDAIEDSDYELREDYRQKKDGIEVIGWYFAYTLRMNFDFSYYPFDDKDIKIRIWHQDFNNGDLNRRVILAPSLNSYSVINPRTTPGVEQDIVLGEWYLRDSFFEYVFKTYNTNFGVLDTVPKTNFPELQFTVILQRSFLGLFISKLGPMIVVLTLLFAVLLVSNQEQTMEVLGACAGFVFIVILDQVTVRQQVITRGVVYLEYFYFVVYLYIFLVAINFILWSLNPNLPSIKYKNNFLFKAMYWPTMLKVLLLITIFVFI
ncbi:MAG: Cache 3/Cache 2 fusion domain-containing protein [Microcoleaceae cyanobacterium MO_207.B10]|nr:Cache 3/Cache 2 fusion domain-containing protein [Microcoleaceae cyanobacterium MO_207.B10]